MAISYATARGAPLLDMEQERILIGRWQAERDRTALEALILSHARQVYACAARLCFDAADREDLIAEGMVGLIRAANRFDLAREVRFSTYAHWWILHSATRALARLNNVVDLPARAQRAAGKAKQATPLDGSGDALEAMQSPDPTPEERMIARTANARLRRLIAEAMGELGDVEREIVLSRNLRQVPDTIEDLAVRLGVSREKLRLIERRAMSRLKYGLLSRGVTAAQLG
ncbi:sigma-70 family RNA polymerase sigma factor [Antarcticimicrobium luteum]|uniref:Sigma-70 family RNA polymerase sigma factor n=1 Tax=Antarcticimicrobium luteum TaxID=2547397 RepID=A0A4R5VDC8_9RHOB|nr:sigma-70 family RNA polymerase sigma factor [Antarcticimicrobium luteum]TDK50220.1 sigma-70 family RNA polymerase sigma factor [Antarcticimicrobium luteum]